MIKKDLIINIFLGIIIFSWNIFIGKIIVCHGLGYLGNVGGFKLDCVIISALIVLDICLTLFFVLFNREK